MNYYFMGLYPTSLSHTSRVCMDFNIICIIIIIIDGLTGGTPFITYNNALFLEFKSKDLNAQINYGDNSFTVRLS